MKTVLHPGCGMGELPEWLAPLKEVRLDIDETCNPDIVASITDMGDIGQFDMIYTSHTLEHLYDFDVVKALSEFNRVLKPDGLAIIIVPDVEDVVCNRETLYDSPAGPICGIDLYFGLTSAVKANPYYAHHMAFIAKTLDSAMREAGFDFVYTKRLENYNLMGVGKKGV
jgi:SAM-dependent methyltransferase